VIRLAVLTLLGAALAAPADPLTPLDEKGLASLVAAHKGKVLLVDFWATWCEPCRKEMPLLVKLEQKLKAKGLAFTTVSCDEPEDAAQAAEFLKKAGVTGTLYLKRVKNDDAFIRSMDPKWSGALPALFIYDRTGKKVRSIIGEADLAKLEADLAKLL
jgi:thiol-disulfide isomerase/thioredoxin